MRVCIWIGLTHKACKFKPKMINIVSMLMVKCQCVNGLWVETIEKQTHENNLVQIEDNNANEMVFKVCLLLVQITMWLEMA